MNKLDRERRWEKCEKKCAGYFEIEQNQVGTECYISIEVL